VAHFDGGNISSDAGGLLLQQTEQITGIIAQFADCCTGHRDPDLSEDTVKELVAQQVYAMPLGYEDLNNHNELCNDPSPAVLDRLTHRVHIIEANGPGYRLRESKRRLKNSKKNTDNKDSQQQDRTGEDSQ
jgi:hypothetical protein